MLKKWPETYTKVLLGANGTEAMQALLEKGGRELVDYLKVGPFMGWEAIEGLVSHSPLLMHLDDTLSGAKLLSPDAIAAIQDWIEWSGSPWASEHIGFGVADADLDEALIMQPTSTLLSRDAAMRNIISNARHLAGQLEVPLLLENLPLFPNVAHIHICEPDFVTEVIESSGCDLLLDLAHARAAADVLGYDVHAYLEALPLERTVEIHVSGPRRVYELAPARKQWIQANAASVSHLISFDENSLVDAHEPLREPDYALLDWVLKRCQPKAISLEYYRESVALKEQLERMGNMLGR